MAATVLACAVVTLFLPEPKHPAANRAPQGYADFLQTAVVDPIMDFIRRDGWWIILAFILLYKYGEAFGGAMANPFYHEMGFSGTEIALVSKIYGVIATLVGGVLGGFLVARFGLFRTLMMGGILQAVTILLMSALAWRQTHGADHDELMLWLMAAITAENVTAGVASAALVAYLSGLCNSAYTATQYALFSSLMAFGRTILAAGSGWLIDYLDDNWALFWAVTVVMAVPGLLLLVWISRLYPDEKRIVPAAA
jgi:PAT family beta-lactamase induction signal transducer AmpG